MKLSKVQKMSPNAGDSGNQESNTEEFSAESMEEIYESAGELNTRITAFLTYLKLPRAVKMTVCPIKKKISNNFSFTVSYKYFLTFVVYLVMT